VAIEQYVNLNTPKTVVWFLVDGGDKQHFVKNGTKRSKFNASELPSQAYVKMTPPLNLTGDFLRLGFFKVRRTFGLFPWFIWSSSQPFKVSWYLVYISITNDNDAFSGDIMKIVYGVRLF
jgi:hypothetical protein